MFNKKLSLKYLSQIEKNLDFLKKIKKKFIITFNSSICNLYSFFSKSLRGQYIKFPNIFIYFNIFIKSISNITNFYTFKEFDISFPQNITRPKKLIKKLNKISIICL